MHEHASEEHRSCGKARPSWGKRLLLSSLIVAPLCVVAPYVYFVISSNQEYQQAVAEADQLDPGWRIPELEQKREIIPDVGNSGLVLIAAKKLLPPNWPIWDHPQVPESQKHSQEELRSLQESLADSLLCVQLDERQTAALREELQRAEKALTTARKVVDLPCGRYPITYTKDLISTLLPHLQDARSMGNLLGYDVLLRVQDGDVDGALMSCRGILNCGRSIGDEPTLVSMLVRLALDDLAIKTLARILAHGQPSEAALSAMQHELAVEAAEPLLLIGVRGERAMADGAMQAIQDGALDPAFVEAMISEGGKSRYAGSAQLLRIPGMANGLRAAFLRQNNRFVEIAKLPAEQQIEPIKQLLAAIQELPELARPWAAAAHKPAGAFHRHQAVLRCAVVMVAVERARHASLRWPAKLTDLVPSYLPQVPLDPFDGAPLRYRRLDDGVVIYSIGPDGKDNGGKLDRDGTKEGTDLGFRLWDVPQRREPPKPPEHQEQGKK